jgi:hypothetical protein
MPTKIKWTLNIDGKPYQETKLDEGFALVKYVVPALGNKILGFSSDQSLLQWADKQGERKIYDDCLKGAEKARKEHDKLSDKEMETYEKELSKEMKKTMANFNEVLKRESVAPNEAEKILKLAKDGKIGTLYLYSGLYGIQIVCPHREMGG